MDQPVAPPWLDSLSDAFRRRFEFRRLLGAGVTSCVYQARQASLERDVVVKLLRTEFEPDSDVAERFRREAAVLAGLRHDRVVSLLDFGTDGDVLYMVYPDVGGESLDGWLLDRQPLVVTEAIPLLADILEGLAVIHAAGIVHRDLKPANLLLADDGRVLLIDFGLAKSRDGRSSLTGTGHIVGTPNYMAPGQVLGEPTSPGDDLYAVGVIAYEMLVGRNPFSAGDLTATLQNHLTLRPDSPARQRGDVPADLAEWVMDLLEKSEADRIPSAEVARDRLVAMEGVRTLPGVWIPAKGEDGPSRTQMMRRWVAQRAARPAPRTGGGWRVPLALFAAVTLLAWLWPGSPGEGTGEGATAPPPAPASPEGPRAARGPPLPAGLVVAVEEELVALFERRVDGGGRVTDDPDAPRSISSDPARWGDVFLRLHALRRFHDWLAAGGRPEELAPAVHQEMARVDGVFRDLGFLPPFLPYREGRPAAAPVPPVDLPAIGERPFFDDYDSSSWPGWAGRVRLAVCALEARRKERSRVLEQAIAAEAWARLPPGFARYLSVVELVRPELAEADRQLSRAFAFYDSTDRARREYVRWMDPDQALTRDLLWAVARTVRDQPEYADRVAYLAWYWGDQFRALLRGPVLHASPTYGLGFVPEGPRGELLRGSFRVWADLEGDYPVFADEAAAAFLRSLEPTGDSPWARRRLASAMRLGAASFARAGDVPGWERLVRRSVDLLPGLEEELRGRVVTEVVWSAQVWAERVPPEQRTALGAALGRVRPALAPLAPGVDPPLRELQAELQR